ncbi:hypothetical protein N8257_00640 [Ulvibacter sp.]|jgi:hypothetical protein|nr:hypothetical protein [Ulvibacter sp.]
MTDRANLPHKAIIHIGIAVHEVLKNGDLDPIPASEEELSRYDLGRHAKMCINGFDRADCIKKIKELLEKLDG